MKKVYVMIGILILGNLAGLYYIVQQNQIINELENRVSSQEVREVQMQECEFELPLERSMPIVAVAQEGEGALGNVTIQLIQGEGDVLINTNPFVEADLQYSLNKAVFVAKNLTGINYAVDYIVEYNADSVLIGGGSAGAATTILVMSSLEARELKKDAVITGSIEPNGKIGQVRGLIEKARAVSDAGYRYFLIPEGQATFTYYERVVTQDTFFPGLTINNVEYVPRQVNLTEFAQQELDLQVVEVGHVNEALPYFFEDA